MLGAFEPLVESGQALACDFRVALICMPFSSAERPSIQLGLLSAIAAQSGYSVDSYHFNLDLASELSPQLYERFCEHRGQMTGEWLFAPSAFGSDAPFNDLAFFQRFPDEVDWANEIGIDSTFLSNLRHMLLPGFIDGCVTKIDWGQYRLIGFSSTFQQNVASLALARRLKSRYPHIAIVFGGANMDSEMGVENLRAFPFVDFVAIGEADLSFPALLDALANGKARDGIPGILCQDKALVDAPPARPTSGLSVLPTPNYDLYFERATELGLLTHYKGLWSLPFESSRGCWWGNKQHCTFCGLNGLNMSFRAKSPQRVLEELSELSRRYRITSFTAVDNILDLNFIKEFFPKIGEARADFQFFYEVKANLTREQIRTLYLGGVRRIQPGIESMSTHILKLMRKGSSMLQNVRCLKWCYYYGIRVSWNLIWGFPGETEDDYSRELKVLKSISHLEPPISCSRIWLERFSPHFWDREKYGVRNVRPKDSYSYVYPEFVDLKKISYFFEYEMDNVVPSETHGSTQRWIVEWQASWCSGYRHSLTYRRTFEGLLVDFDWGPERNGTISLPGPLGEIYEFCGDTIHTPRQVVDYLVSLDKDYRFAESDVQDVLDILCSRGLMLGDDGKYLSLALPANPNW